MPHALKHRPALFAVGSACGSGKVKALRPKQVSSCSIWSTIVSLLLNLGSESGTCLQASAVPKKQVDLNVLHAFNLSMFAGGGVLYVAIFNALVNYLDTCIFADPFCFLIQCWQTTIAKGSSKSF